MHDSYECPECGCGDVAEVGRGTWWGKPHVHLACNHCGHAFTRAAPDAPAGVEFPTLRCPGCGSANIVVASTRIPLRRHKCRACGQAFKSIERAA